MDGDKKLVQTLLERLASRLPNQTGIADLDAVRRDEVVSLSRETLIEVAKSQIDVVIRYLVELLDGISRQYESIAPRNRPPLAFATQTYLLELLADCTSAHWDAVEAKAFPNERNFSNAIPGAPYIPTRPAHRREPPALDDNLAKHALDCIIRLIAQPVVSEDHSTINSSRPTVPSDEPPMDGVMAKPTELDMAAHRVIEYLSASNWSLAYNIIQTKLRFLRHASDQRGSTKPAAEDAEASSLQFMAHMWLNAKKLSLIIQEVSQAFLILRKSTQNIIATLVPDAIHNWIDTNPREFVELHMTQRRLEGGTETLFDMTVGLQDNNKRRSILWPLQTAIVLLMPEVFWLAGMMGEPKGSGVSTAKKIIFLENLRKSLRLSRSSDIAATCLVNICQAASYFAADSDSALLSFALDVQNEMREEIFRKQSLGSALEESMVDRELMTKAFVSLCHLSIDSVITQLVPWCLERNSPVSWKISVFAGASMLAQQANADDFIRLFSAIAPNIREYLDAIGLSKSPVAMNGGALVRLQQRNVSTESIASPDLLQQILDFLTVRPYVLFELSPPDMGEKIHRLDPYSEQFVSSLLLFMTDEDEMVRKSATAFARRLLAQDPMDFMTSLEQHRDKDAVVNYFWRATSTIAYALAKKLMEFDFRDSGLKGMLNIVHDHLSGRMGVLQLRKEYCEALVDLPERAAANIAMEVAFLVLLCSSDLETCSIATHCIALLCEEGRVTENCEDLAGSNLTIMRNYPVYSELSLPGFRLTGPVAFQKRLRKLLCKMTMPSPGILAAWERVFGRWRILCKHILSPGTGKSEDEIQRLYSEWRNYSGFLASIAGCCISDFPHLIRLDDSSFAGLRWIDRLATDGDSTPLLDRFMKQCLQLLICKLINVRESIREVLATELSPRLYGHLFRSLETELVSLFDFDGGPRDVATTEIRTLFVEQAAGLLKTIVERLEESQDTFLSVDLGALTLTLARYLHPLKDDLTILRVKIKMCLLVELVARKKEILNLRQEIRVRNHLLQLLAEWVSRSKAENGVVSSGAHRKDDRREDERSRLQKDLDRACLRALVNVLYRLPLQPLETHHDADLVDAKSQMFCAYFDTFLALLDGNSQSQDFADRSRDTQTLSLTRDDPSSTVDLTIRALSNLLSANVDVGLKFSLEIGYHEDLEIRTAFMHVLTDILTQGTEFGTLKDNAIAEKYERLVNLLVDNMEFVRALCECCPSTEVDELTIALLNIFDSKGKGLALLKGLIRQEVANTESETELLRRNCVATKMLSVFAKWKGSDYLRKTLQEKLERLIVTSDRLDLELDPARTSSPTELEQNALQIRYLTKIFIDEITNSAQYAPDSFRQICHTITTCVTERFPEAKFTAVGAFIFLRFFLSGNFTSTPKKGIRRGLLLIAKIVQNLANNVLFGAKEPYMIPMNDFLTNNIYQVTAFLREISCAPEGVEKPPEQEGFDFGSSVALHRFFFENWETVRQKLIYKEKARRVHLEGHNRNPDNNFMSVMATLSALIPTLGTPPLDIALGRPNISTAQPAYSRYQGFMLRNSYRSVESILSGRMVYDGGEAKDGTPVICIILRNINVDTVDQDLFLYCFLKIAAKLWHKPFAVLVDATCYSMNNEFSDEFFRKLDGIMPPELAHSFNRFYVYNMNSLYRKNFRKTLRHALKDPKSSLNPQNIEIYLLGNLTELQMHFHLGSLHLPKETISLVTDARHVFQPVTRLSKNKGRIEVVMKVGSQYLQISTTKKQDILPQSQPRMQALVNDIFRLSDVEEANTTIHLSDEKDVFGIKTDNGKTVTYFSSPKRAEILGRIKSAKSKHSRETKPSKLNERTIRPEDVPGTLLNIALMNMASNNRALRLAAYNLLCSLCQAFNFNLDYMPVCAKGISIPTDSVSLVVGFSERLAAAEPQLTFDFLTEFFVGWEKAPPQQKPFIILYLVPWLANLKSQLLCTADGENERGKERLASIARKLIDATIKEPSLYISFQQNAWSAISKEESLLDVFLDELVKAAMNFGFGDPRTEIIGSIAASFNTVNIRGKVIARLRKALNRTSVRATRHLIDHGGWNEICVLLGICLAISFDSRVQAQLFLPELFHIITLVVNCGPLPVRTAVHSLLVNTVHSICISFPLEECNLMKLKAILASLSEPRYCLLFNLYRPTRDASTEYAEPENPVSAMEAITNLLLDIIAVAAPSIDMANIWRARWMSLVASTAFQSNPAIQPRAFAVMGCLAREDIDDDLLYQVLVALRTAIARYQQDNDAEMLISIITSLTKMMDNLPPTSRYLLQLFWLAMALCRAGSGFIFNCSANLLEVALRVISNSGEFKDGRLAHVLLSGRIPVEEAAGAIDDLYGIRFDQDAFHFSVVLSLIKGLQDSTTRVVTLKTMNAFMEVAANNAGPGGPPRDSPYLGPIAARATTVEDLKEIFWTANLPFHLEDEKDGVTFMRSLPPFSSLRDKNVLLWAALVAVDFNNSGESVQLHCITFFTQLATSRPDIFSLIYDVILDCLDELLLTTQNSTVLKRARHLICATATNPLFDNRRNAKEVLSKTLEEYGFSGIWKSTSFDKCIGLEKRCMALTDELVKLIIQ
ncbi:hypothetical protein BDZ91DRAFT_746797 [Kalaharituber pfeilii]|nr:hypothetical protein BDZ91DRAFT_746797 [Kalaharituber pfeilii]